MSDTVEIELHPAEVGALRGAVEVYRQRFLPTGSDTAEDQALETVINSVHEKLQDLDLSDEECVEAGDTDRE